jgi:hypothetical protein
VKPAQPEFIAGEHQVNQLSWRFSKHLTSAQVLCERLVRTIDGLVCVVGQPDDIVLCATVVIWSASSQVNLAMTDTGSWYRLRRAIEKSRGDQFTPRPFSTFLSGGLNRTLKT